MQQTYTSVFGASGANVTITFNMAVGPNFRTMLLRVLALPEDATFEEARASHRKLVKTHHPDVGGDPEKFRNIQAAWETLKEHPW